MTGNINIIYIFLSISVLFHISSCSKEDDGKDTNIYLSSKEVELDYNETHTTIQIYGDVKGFTLEYTRDWLSESFIYGNELHIVASINQSSEERYGAVYLVNYNLSYYEDNTIHITQKGNPNFNNSNDSNDNNTNKLSTPSGVSLTNIGSSSYPEVQISWNSVSNATSYQILRKWENATVLHYAETSNEYYIDYDVWPGITYSYQVMAVSKGYQDSNWSPIVQISL